MTNPKLAHALRSRAEQILAIEGISRMQADNAECLIVLARICEGQLPAKAFGAPGDWGYGTPIGDAHFTGWTQPAAPSLDKCHGSEVAS